MVARVRRSGLEREERRDFTLLSERTVKGIFLRVVGWCCLEYVAVRECGWGMVGCRFDVLLIC